MKIIKIIVDKLPNNCLECTYHSCRLGCKANSYEPIIRAKYRTQRHQDCLLKEFSKDGRCKKIKCEHCQGDKNVLKCDISGYTSGGKKVMVAKDAFLCQHCRTEKRLNGLVVNQNN